MSGPKFVKLLALLLLGFAVNGAVVLLALRKGQQFGSAADWTLLVLVIAFVLVVIAYVFKEANHKA